MNKLTNLDPLFKAMQGKKDVMRNIIDIFLKQVPQDLVVMNEAVAKINYVSITNCAHKMKSTISVFGISHLLSVLEEMETLGKTEGKIGRIKQLNEVLNNKCGQVIEEIKQERLTSYQ